MPWSAVEAFLVILGAYLLAALAAALRLSLAEAGVVSPEALEGWALPLQFVVLGMPALLWVAARHRDGVRRLFGRLRDPLRTLGIGLALGVGVFVLTRVALALLLLAAGGGEVPDLPEVQQDYREMARDPALAAWFMLTVVLIGPAVEEILFRGILYQALRDLLGVWPGIGISSVVFTVLHLNPTGGLDANLLVFVMLFPLALFLAWIFQRLGSLVVPIAVHATYNLIGFWIFRLAG